MKRFFVPALLFVSFLLSCKKEPDPAPVNGDPAAWPGTDGVFVTCEGNFMAGNATVSYFNYANGLVNTDLYHTVNNLPLGDVCQSMRIFNGKAYMVVNNSAKIEVVNASSFQYAHTLQNFVSPRYILPVSSSKAYVTDLYSNCVYIVDLNLNLTTGNIPLMGWKEELLKTDSMVWVSHMERDWVYLINSQTDQLSDSVQLSYASNSMQLDGNGKLWVLCGGDVTNSIPGALHRVNPATRQVEASFPFPAGQSPWKLRMNPGRDTIYFLNSGVYRMAITDAALPSTAFIAQGTANFYGLGIDPTHNIIYVSDAIDFVQPGQVRRYRPDGTLLGQFGVGIAPGDFGFD